MLLLWARASNCIRPKGLPKKDAMLSIAPHLPVEEYRLCFLAEKLP
jgi:hypothetical protein